MRYQWDPDKAQSNLEKHNVDFADAVGVFEDEWALTIQGQDVDDEQRYGKGRKISDKYQIWIEARNRYLLKPPAAAAYV